MEENTLQFALVSAITALIVQLSKKLKIEIKEEYLPMISVFIGTIGNVLFYLLTNDFNIHDILNTLLTGGLAGFTASGAYDNIKVISKHTKKNGSDNFEE